jgi:2-phosphoglycerate kinase
MKQSLEMKLRKEREILGRLIDEALENGTPISETKSIAEQCRKVNEIIMEMKREEGKTSF